VIGKLYRVAEKIYEHLTYLGLVSYNVLGQIPRSAHLKLKSLCLGPDAKHHFHIFQETVEIKGCLVACKAARLNFRHLEDLVIEQKMSPPVNHFNAFSRPRSSDRTSVDEAKNGVERCESRHVGEKRALGSISRFSRILARRKSASAFLISVMSTPEVGMPIRFPLMSFSGILPRPINGHPW
jgi:hypothetical protein